MSGIIYVPLLAQSPRSLHCITSLTVRQNESTAYITCLTRRIAPSLSHRESSTPWISLVFEDPWEHHLCFFFSLSQEAPVVRPSFNWLSVIKDGNGIWQLLYKWSPIPQGVNSRWDNIHSLTGVEESKIYSCTCESGGQLLKRKLCGIASPKTCGY